MRIGYSYWGFLGDVKFDGAGNELSTPDGNATYSWSIIWEAQRRGHTVYAMQDDRDWPGYKKMGSDLFAAFSQEKRLDCYLKMKHTFGSSQILPELDVLLIEWRFPIPGRNCDEVPDTKLENGQKAYSFNPEKHQPDFFRQLELLNHYKGTKTKIVFWDLDHKLDKAVEASWQPDAVFETSHSPLELSMKRTRVEPPFHIPDLLQHPTLPPNVANGKGRRLVYIGSRYERDDVIDEWIKPISEKHPGEVEFIGKWDVEAQQRWPKIHYEPRIGVKDFRLWYGEAGCVPLLAKKSYLETGFITPRPWEALLFGTIPVGLSTHLGVQQYVGPWVAKDADDLDEISELLTFADVKYRDDERRFLAEQLEFMDVRHFVDKLENV